MLKKIILTIILFTGMSAFSAENYLNSVVISENDGKTSIVLRSDETAKVKKEITSPDKIVLTLKGVSQSPNINTLYKNVANINSLIIQNDNSNDLKIYIEAPEIFKAEIVFETPDSAPLSVINNISIEKTVWSIISILMLLAIMYSARNFTAEKPQKDINEIIKEREKTLYRKFQKEVSSLPSMNYKLKSYRKHVLKGETIRSYENRTATKI